MLIFSLFSVETAALKAICTGAATDSLTSSFPISASSVILNIRLNILISCACLASFKGMFYSAVFSPSPMVLYTSPPGGPVNVATNSASLGSIQSHVSNTLYSQVLLCTPE